MLSPKCHRAHVCVALLSLVENRNYLPTPFAMQPRSSFCSPAPGDMLPLNECFHIEAHFNYRIRSAVCVSRLSVCSLNCYCLSLSLPVSTWLCPNQTTLSSARTFILFEPVEVNASILVRANLIFQYFLHYFYSHYSCNCIFDQIFQRFDRSDSRPIQKCLFICRNLSGFCFIYNGDCSEGKENVVLTRTELIRVLEQFLRCWEICGKENQVEKNTRRKK